MGESGGSPILAQQHQLLQVGAYRGAQAHMPLGARHLPALPTKQRRPHATGLTKFSALLLGGRGDGLSPSR